MALSALATAGIAGGSGALDYFSAKSLQGDSQSFTRSMMRNKHQWEVDDLRKAGLNPVLSAHGSGPIGGSSTGSASPGTSAMTSALALRRQNQELLNMRETEQKTQGENRVIAQQLRVAKVEASIADARLKYYTDHPARIGEEIKAGIAGRINSAYAATLAAGLTVDDIIQTPPDKKTKRKNKHKQGKKYNPIEGWHD